MDARPVRTSTLARNQVIASSASSAACVFDGSRLAARRDRVQARTSVRDAADQVRRYQAAAAAASNSGAKFAVKTLAAWSACRCTDDDGAPGDGLQTPGRILHPSLRGVLPLTGGAGRLATAPACSVTRADFCTPVLSTCADQHLSERITPLYKLVRSSFNFVRRSRTHHRHDGTDFRHFHFSTPTHPHPLPTSTLLRILTFPHACSPCACRIRPW